MIEAIVVVFFLVVSILSIITAIFAFKYATDAKIQVEAFKKSTHKIEFQPVDFKMQNLDDKDINDPFNPDEDVAKHMNGEFDVLKNFKKELYDRMDTLD